MSLFLLFHFECAIPYVCFCVSSNNQRISVSCRMQERKINWYQMTDLGSNLMAFRIFYYGWQCLMRRTLYVRRIYCLFIVQLDVLCKRRRHCDLRALFALYSHCICIASCPIAASSRCDWPRNRNHDVTKRDVCSLCLNFCTIYFFYILFIFHFFLLI